MHVTSHQLEAVEPYEHRLTVDRELSMTEADRFFTGESRVHLTLRHIVRELERLQIPYSLVGGMALYQHGFRRFTEDVDILVTRDGLKRIHRELTGRGYLPPFEKSKNLRDTETGVRIEFLIAGQYPGDGKKKPVAFPDPAGVTEWVDGIAVARLSTLIELKLASGMTIAGRIKDLGDVQEMIKLFGLPLEYSEQLDPYVRDKYAELWTGARQPMNRFVRVWRTDLLVTDAMSLAEIAAALRSAADELNAMMDDGVQVDATRGVDSGSVDLITEDPDVARKYGMHEESEFFDADGEEPS
jgi:hypothetical protein